MKKMSFRLVCCAMLLCATLQLSAFAGSLVGEGEVVSRVPGVFRNFISAPYGEPSQYHLKDALGNDKATEFEAKTKTLFEQGDYDYPLIQSVEFVQDGGIEYLPRLTDQKRDATILEDGIHIRYNDLFRVYIENSISGAGDVGWHSRYYVHNGESAPTVSD
jgi:hypothetical protein